MLDLVRLHAPLKADFQAALDEALSTGRFINGPAVDAFEGALADHVGAAHAVGVSSGTDALLVALMALGVGPGDEVITTPYTFFATAGSIVRLGARPRFVDIDPGTFNIDPAQVADAVGPNTVGVIPVHLFGQCADMEPILALAEAAGIWVLEDAAQAIGAAVHGRQAGTLGVAGTYSFFPAKNLGALGDGGAVVTGDPALGERLRSLRHHGAGAGAKYAHELIGGNFRLDALQAAFLSAKLPRLRAWEAGRRRVAGRYAEGLAGIEALRLPRETDGCRHVFNQYVVRTPFRDELRRALGDAGIGSAVYYPRPLHLQRCFEFLGHKRGEFPVSEAAALDSLALPVDPLLEERDQARIVSVIRGCVET